MYRILLVELDGVLGHMRRANSSVTELPWLPLLADLLRPWSDVRIVVTSAGPNPPPVSDLPRLLGELAPRLQGNTFLMPRVDATHAAAQVNNEQVEHMVLVSNAFGLGGGRLNVLECDPELGLSSSHIQEMLTQWLRATAEQDVQLVHKGKPPKGFGERVIYLDFDGVLHHEDVRWSAKRRAYLNVPGHQLFEHASLLEALLAPYPQLRIVLSTSWARVYSFDKAARRLPSSLRRRVIGATWHSEMDKLIFTGQTRGMQVVSDVARRRPRDWLALDDDDEGWPQEVREKVLVTDERLGLSAPDMQQRLTDALKRLSGVC